MSVIARSAARVAAIEYRIECVAGISSHDMTFAVVLASRTAIWACADRQITDLRGPKYSSKSGVKITCIETKDGVALLAYAGIGRVRDMQVSQWAYRTLRGVNLPLEGSLEHVSAAAQRRLAPLVLRMRTGHFFIAAAIRYRKHYIYAIDLLNQPPKIIRHETRTRNEVRIGVAESGAPYALRHEQSRMKGIARLIKQHERGVVSAELVASQLASLNEAINERAKSNGDNSVSPESIVIYRHPRSKKSGGRQWCFDLAGKPYNDPDALVPTGVSGFPLSELADGIMGEMLKRMRATPADATPEQRLAAMPNDETMRALVARIPDKPDEQFR